MLTIFNFLAAFCCTMSDDDNVYILFKDNKTPVLISISELSICSYFLSKLKENPHPNILECDFITLNDFKLIFSVFKKQEEVENVDFNLSKIIEMGKFAILLGIKEPFLFFINLIQYLEITRENAEIIRISSHSISQKTPPNEILIWFHLCYALLHRILNGVNAAIFDDFEYIKASNEQQTNRIEIRSTIKNRFFYISSRNIYNLKIKYQNNSKEKSVKIPFENLFSLIIWITKNIIEFHTKDEFFPNEICFCNSFDNYKIDSNFMVNFFEKIYPSNLLNLITRIHISGCKINPSLSKILANLPVLSTLSLLNCNIDSKFITSKSAKNSTIFENLVTLQIYCCRIDIKTNSLKIKFGKKLKHLYFDLDFENSQKISFNFSGSECNIIDLELKLSDSSECWIFDTIKKYLSIKSLNLFIHFLEYKHMQDFIFKLKQVLCSLDLIALNIICCEGILRSSDLYLKGQIKLKYLMLSGVIIDKLLIDSSDVEVYFWKCIFIKYLPKSIIESQKSFNFLFIYTLNNNIIQDVFEIKNDSNNCKIGIEIDFEQVKNNSNQKKIEEDSKNVKEFVKNIDILHIKNFSDQHLKRAETIFKSIQKIPIKRLSFEKCSSISKLFEYINFNEAEYIHIYRCINVCVIGKILEMLNYGQSKLRKLKIIGFKSILDTEYENLKKLSKNIGDIEIDYREKSFAEYNFLQILTNIILKIENIGEREVYIVHLL